MSFGNVPKIFLNFSQADVNEENKHIFRFKSFRLDVEERQLLHHERAVPLTPKAFEVLAFLVERNGHLVGKDELLEKVWADSFVEEVNVARIVHTLRKTLGEDENGNKFIETVAKKGYRFVAKVTEISEPDAPQPNSRQSAAAVGSQDGANEELPSVNRQLPTVTNPSATAGGSDLETAAPSIAKPKQNTRIILFTVGFLSAVSLLLLLSFNFKSGSSTNPNKVKSIAILPVQPLTAENRDVIYEFGIADSLTLKLGAAKNLIVRPLSATRQYADITQDALAAGRELQVDYVLASNYQIADGKIRVTSQLFNIATGQIEETYKSEKETGNIFATQDAIAGEVGNIILARFATTESSPKAMRGTTNEEAYRLYLQGMILGDQRNGKKAIENFEQAVTLDPNYALAWAGIARTSDYQKSIEAANKALALDPNLSEGHSALCWSKFDYEYDFAGAERECKRALELDPNSPVAHNIYASYLFSRGRFDEAIAEIKTAIDLDPKSYFNQRVYANGLYFARRYEEAVAQYKRMIDLNEEAAPTYQWLIRTLEAQGNESEAFEWFLKSLTLQKTDNATIQRFKTAYQRAGWQGVLLERNRNSNSDGGFRSACLNARLGNKDKAFEYLERSYQKHEWLIPFLQVEPQLDSLRDDPRFDEMLRRVGLK